MRWVLPPDKKFTENDDKEVHGEIDVNIMMMHTCHTQYVILGR